MKFWFPIIISFIFIKCSFAQGLPLDRLYNWSNVGSKINLPLSENNVVINFAEFSSSYSNLDFALSSAIFQLPEGGTLFFPAGEYTFTQTVQVPNSVTLQGAASCETTLIFDLENGGNAFNISGTQVQGFSFLSETAFRKSNGLYLQDIEPFSVGDWIKISFDDSELVTSSWAVNSVGQIAQIVNIQESLIIIDSELRLSYEFDKEPFVQKISPRQGVSINSMKIVRNDATTAQTSNFHFNYAVNCQIENIESERCNFAHVGIYNSAHLTIKNNYFHKAHDYGGGGKAYGVALQFLSSECLIENNIFDSLRHSMLLQAGANGNVLAYNYSTHPYWTGTTLPSDSAGDLVLHGNYVFANLSEGNVVANIVIDDSHGRNGPHNTFLRNRTEGYGFFMNSGSPTDYVNFIGNETTGAIGLWWIQGEGHFQYANNILGEITPATTVEEFDNSLFTTEIPTYFDIDNSVFPSIGFPNTPSQNILPAQSRHNEEYYFSDCLASSTSSIEHDLLNEENLIIHPNPTYGQLFWKHSEEDLELNLSIFNSRGERVKTQKTYETRGHSDLSNLPNGIYFIEVINKSGLKYRKKILLVR
jgi:hypothetical protein